MPRVRQGRLGPGTCAHQRAGRVLEEELLDKAADPSVNDERADDADDHQYPDDSALVVDVHQPAPVHLVHAQEEAGVGRKSCRSVDNWIIETLDWAKRRNVPAVFQPLVYVYKDPNNTTRRGKQERMESIVSGWR